MNSLLTVSDYGERQRRDYHPRQERLLRCQCGLRLHRPPKRPGFAPVQGQTPRDERGRTSILRTCGAFCFPPQEPIL